MTTHLDHEIVTERSGGPAPISGEHTSEDESSNAVKAVEESSATLYVISKLDFPQFRRD
jgi:hypothetical protein